MGLHSQIFPLYYAYSFLFLNFCRKNVYDGVDEYYVVIKEKGQRSQELSHEEIRKKTERLEARWR